jgi:hypothetical protein
LLVLVLRVLLSLDRRVLLLGVLLWSVLLVRVLLLRVLLQTSL